MEKLLIVFLFLISVSAVALEVDEKLTIRFLRVSDTQKTVLINRGIEDGLVVGDHAMFFLTTGVIARGVTVKVSPSRSIWSLYRLVTPEEIAENKVAKLKITSAVKLTDDPSKMLSEEKSKNISEVISLAEGANDLPEEATDEEKQELQSLGSTPAPVDAKTVYGKSLDDVVMVGTAYEKNWELFANVGLNALKTTSSLGVAGTNQGDNSIYDFGIGVERYFKDQKSFLHPFSVQFLVHYFSIGLSGVEGDDVAVSALEYGVGINWHFWAANPFVFNKYIGFVNFSLGLGNTSDSIKTNQINSTTSSNSYEYSGTLNYLSLGLGLKYYISNGLGGRVLLDYYRRGETYLIEDLDDPYTKVVEGPRITASLGYRW